MPVIGTDNASDTDKTLGTKTSTQTLFVFREQTLLPSLPIRAVALAQGCCCY